MILEIRLDTEKSRRLMEKLNALKDEEIVNAALFVGAETLKRIMAEYPPVSRRPQPFKTDKQRRYVFWALRKGLIVIPYYRGQNPRSEDMKHRWAINRIARGVELRNNASYVQLVHGWQRQADYHKGTGWRTDRSVIEQDGPKIADDVRAAYMTALQKVWQQT